jgi:NurA domain
MLDLNKIAKQLPQVGQHLTKEAQASNLRMRRANDYLIKAIDQQSDLEQLQVIWNNKFRFGAAIPVEDLSTCQDISAAVPAHTVLATDGSQISPSHHEIAYCYLINIGRVMIHYGQDLHPLLDSIPEVFYQTKDLYQSRQWGISTEEWLGYQRTVDEALLLGDLGFDWANPPIGFEEIVNPQPPKVPTLAMVDGSLIYRFLEELPSEARELTIAPILTAWDKLRQAKIPMISYISSSRSIDGLNFLRLLGCGFPEPDCTKHCIDVERPPCQIFDGLRDTSLWLNRLQPGQRSCLWQSTARALDFYSQEQRVYFCYVNVGAEIARVEMPAWVAIDDQLLDQALGIMLAQVKKGQGYPVALAEAHNYAVVRGADRSSFFALLEREMVKAGLQNVGVSYKERRKRVSIA